ncbi:MAG: DUF2304 domain-containing protein [Clostridium sp.]|nr:DUF2304 domain-containing protein [Clostridium sp.]
MKISFYSISLIFSIFFLLVVVELVRKNKLQERYSLFWIAIGVVSLMLSGTGSILDNLSRKFNIKNFPTLFFLVALLFLIAYTLNITVVISKQNEKIIRLTQELSLLKQKMSDKG